MSEHGPEPVIRDQLQIIAALYLLGIVALLVYAFLRCARGNCDLLRALQTLDGAESATHGHG